MLKEMGIDFEIMVSDVDEKAIRLEDPQELTLTLSRAKAEALKAKISEPAILITSDQVVVWNGIIREKPESEAEAREFLKGYNLYPAEAVTAVVVTNLATGKTAEAVDVAQVFFRTFSDDKIDEFIAAGGVYNWAGGFTVDGEKWESQVEKIVGARDGVIGLPKDLTRKLMAEVLE